MVGKFIWTKRSIFNATIIIGIHFVVFFFAILLSEKYNYISSIILLLWGICLYLFHEKKYADIIHPIAVFSGIWICSIGLAQLRLSRLQTPWLLSVWIAFMLVPLLFWWALSITQNQLNKKNRKISCFTDIKKTENLNYPILLIISGFICFILLLFQYLIKGFFPAFTNDVKARFDFYTKLVILIVGTQAYMPMIIECFYEKKINAVERILLLLAAFIIFSSTILRVSRGDSLITAIISVPVLVRCISNKYITRYGNKKGKIKFKKRIIVLILIVSGLFVLLSSLRADSSAQLKNAFQLKYFGNKLLDSKFFSYFYIYIANGIENFNYEVVHCKQFTFGLRQLAPIAPFFSNLRESLRFLPIYVNTYSTTTCIIRDFYLDFGFFGVYIGIIIFGCIIGFMHYYYSLHNDFAISSIYGIGFCMCCLCFFDAWLSIFTIWLLLGFVFFIWYIHKIKLY